MIINGYDIPLHELKTEKKRREFFENPNNWALIDEECFWRYESMDIDGHGTFYRLITTSRTRIGKCETHSHVAEWFFVLPGKDHGAFDYSMRMTAALDEFKSIYIKELANG